MAYLSIICTLMLENISLSSAGRCASSFLFSPIVVVEIFQLISLKICMKKKKNNESNGNGCMLPLGVCCLHLLLQ